MSANILLQAVNLLVIRFCRTLAVILTAVTYCLKAASYAAEGLMT